MGCGGPGGPPVAGRRKGSVRWWLVPLGCHVPTQLLVPLEGFIAARCVPWVGGKNPLNNKIVKYCFDLSFFIIF